MKTTESVVFSPINEPDKSKISDILAEVLETLLTRTDGVSITIERDDKFPSMNGKSLITDVKIKMWDIAA